ncbi:hypothetical protein Rhopal_004890-T1 [Rhodotorula paludigena]|uniref:AB hydrolase-1 domain-containing protein n=1 Tax=Rhodotorula paludigena TaxID=86838 RepID=A0AAV5GH25_9BASI|nr:hypothetical protein Rhopal_004890-T1 [Rhodotorula paludigena]
MSIPDFHVASVASGCDLAYIDSWHGRPASELPTSYTTLIGIHGVGFNSAVWTPLLPSLPTSVRFLAYNQRSYAQSSPAFEVKEGGGVDATAQYLCDLMDFVQWAIDTLHLPALDEQSQEGGIVLMGWSKGTVPLISLLSLLHLSAAPSPTSFLAHLPPSGLPHASLLKTRLRSILLFEAPGSAFGRPPTADYTNAMASVSPPNTSTPNEFAAAFAGWIGQYCDPLSLSDPPAADLPPSGLASLSPELLSRAWEPHCVAHGFSWRLAADADEVQRLARVALAPPGGVAVPVGFIYGTRTNGYCLDAARVVEEWWGVSGAAARRDEEGAEKSGSKTAVRAVEGTNHFAFVHEPEAFARAVLELVDELSP